MKVYRIAEIARALDTDPDLVGKWRERHKLPAPDAELATGPVWLAATHRTGYLEPPTARWDMLNEAVVTIECEAHEPSVAVETVQSVIRRNAELIAHIGVREIQIISISPAD